MNQKYSYLQSIKVIVLALLIAVGTSYLSAWDVPPSGTPPTCPAGYSGCDAPLNVGSLGQTKTGGLTLNTGGAAYGLIVNGSVKLNGDGVLNIPGAGKVLTSDLSGNATWQASPAVPNGFIAFETTGATSWIAPAGVTRVRVRVWGAGGGGAGNDATVSPNRAGAGGGGGAYVESVFTVVPGTTYTINVGAGGVGGNQATLPYNGAAGGTSSFTLGGTEYIKATGGAGGISHRSDIPIGGIGGVYAVNGGRQGFGIKGGYGASGIDASQPEGGSSPMGGSGTSNNRYAAPSAPGGGGGGGVGSNGDTYGFTGARGEVVIEY